MVFGPEGKLNEIELTQTERGGRNKK